MRNNRTDKWFPLIVIDERKIIENSEVIYWMFGIIDRISKESRVFYVLNNRSSDNLLKLIKDNITTNEIQIWI